MHAKIVIEPPCSRWEPGDSTSFPPDDVEFLRQIVEGGFVAFTGPSGLFGGKTEGRTVVVIHRGRGRKWEVVFREAELDVFITTISGLSKAVKSAISWLMNAPIDDVCRELAD
jgi:hypothetical protein